MGHQVEDEDMHAMQHQLDPHSSMMGSGMARHANAPAYVPGHMMTDYHEMSQHQGAPNQSGYNVPHVLPQHMMMVPQGNQNMGTIQMPAQSRGTKKRGRAAAVADEEVEQEQLQDEPLVTPPATKKIAAPKRKGKTESSRTAGNSKRANAAAAMQQQQLNDQMVSNMGGYVTTGPSMNMAGMVHMSHEEDPNNVLLPPNTVLPSQSMRGRESDDSKAAQRSANALREYQRRARETPPERAARRAANAARARQRRAEETAEERARRLHREALRQQRRRDNETERERASRRAANALRQQERRAREAMARQQQAHIRDQMQGQGQMGMPQGHDGSEEEFKTDPAEEYEEDQQQ